MQETFLKAYAELDSFEGRASLATWLHRIAANCAIDLIRRRPAESAPSTPARRDARRQRGAGAGPAGGRARDARATCEAALAELTPLERAAFTLRHLEERIDRGDLQDARAEPLGNPAQHLPGGGKDPARARADRRSAAMNHIAEDLPDRGRARRGGARHARRGRYPPRRRATAAGRMPRSCAAFSERRRSTTCRSAIGLRRTSVGPPRAASPCPCRAQIELG